MGLDSEAWVSPILATSAIGVVFAVLLAMALAELPFAEPLRIIFDAHTQKLMALVAVTATCSSLYYSEVVGFIPCEFCWYQRIMMYSLAVLFVVAIVSRSRLEPRFLLPLALIGLGLAIYHVQLQLFPDQGGVCSGEVVLCTDRDVEEFGFVSIPLMAGAGFLAILLLQVAEWRVDVLYRRWSSLAEAVDMNGAAATIG